jgi:hypothetical protein
VIRLLRTAAVLAVALVVVAACGDDDAVDADAGPGTTVTTTAPATTTTTPVATTTSVADVQLLIVLNPDGLGFTTKDSGSISRLDFGSAQSIVRDTVVKSLGKPLDEGTQSECGQGSRDSSRWDQITLLYADGTFVGWSINRASTLTTADGIGLGTTLAELESSLGDVEVTEGSLGREFTAGAYYGILDETEDVVDFLSAGEICAFR